MRLLIKCPCCGNDIVFQDGQNSAVCSLCQVRQNRPVAFDSSVINMLNEASELRRKIRFDQAKQVYESLIEIHPNECEAYWGVLLCEYGIEYVDDIRKGYQGRKVVTCHRTLENSIFDHPYYKKVMELASEDSKPNYEEVARTIDSVQKDILSLSSEKYDIFICYKELDEKGNRTPDSDKAMKIYSDLQAQNFKVFYSHLTLQSHAGENYEPYIYSALRSAKVMIVLGSKYDYMNAPWVRNEWSRYLSFMKEDPSKHIIFCLLNSMRPSDMPNELIELNVQGLNADEPTFFRNLDNSINRCFNINSGKSSRVIDFSSKDDKKKLLSRARLDLINDNFDEAHEIITSLLAEEFDNKEYWKLEVDALLRGQKKKNPRAVKAFNQLLEQCDDKEKEKYKKKYGFLLNDGIDVTSSKLNEIANKSNETTILEEDEETKKKFSPIYSSLDVFLKKSNLSPKPYFDTSAIRSRRIHNDSFQESSTHVSNMSETKNIGSDKLFEKGEKHFKNKEYLNAVEAFRKASLLGNSKASLRLGDCYYDGLGVLKDYDEAFRYYEEAGALDNQDALNKLGLCYDLGLGTKVNLHEAFHYYQESEKLGSNEAKYNLFHSYRLGRGTMKDDELALKYLEEASLTNLQAMCTLGYYYENGILVPKNESKALELYQKAVNNNCFEAKYLLGKLYVERNDQSNMTKAISLLQEGAKENYLASYELYKIYNEKKVNNGDNEKLALTYLRKSAEQGYRKAQYELGAYYELDHKSDASAYYWYSKAARQNYLDAQEKCQKFEV